jgi:NADH-quinone oxidoreductase subunit M
MLPPYALTQATFLPLAGALAAYILARKLREATGWLAFGLLLYTSLLLALGLWERRPVFEGYGWTPIEGLSFGLLADGLSLPVALVMNVITAALAAYSMPYMKARLRELYGAEQGGLWGLYYLNYLIFSSGLTGVALATNLIELYIFVELILVPAYLLLGFFGYAERQRIALMYFIWNHLGAFIFLAGILVAWFGTRSFEITSLRSLSGGLALLVATLMLVGWLVKMATFGFHVWLPFAYGEFPSSIAAISTIVGLGSYVLTRLLVGQLPSVFQALAYPLMIYALFTLLYAGAMSLVQDDVNRLYAWSTISQTSYLLVGLSSLTALGVSGSILLFLSQILGKAILFAVAGILIAQTGLRDIRQMGGLAAKMPLTATLALGGSLVISGVPPTLGFQAEWVLFSGLFGSGLFGSPVILFVGFAALLGTMLTVAYSLWAVKRIFFGPPSQQAKDPIEAPRGMLVPLLALLALALVIGIYPEPLLGPLYGYVSSLSLAPAPSGG